MKIGTSSIGKSPIGRPFAGRSFAGRSLADYQATWRLLEWRDDEQNIRPELPKPPKKPPKKPAKAVHYWNAEDAEKRIKDWIRDGRKVNLYTEPPHSRPLPVEWAGPDYSFGEIAAEREDGWLTHELARVSGPGHSPHLERFTDGSLV